MCGRKSGNEEVNKLEIMRNEIFKMVRQFYTLKFLPVFTLIFFSSITVIAQNDCCKQKNIGKNTVKNLKSKFGIILPNSVLSYQRHKLKESRVTYLLIKMSVQDSSNFISNTLKTTRPKGMLRDIEDPECRKNPDCPRIGLVFTPSDVPDEIQEWKQNENFEPDTIGSFRLIKKNRYSRYVSFFFDSEKGLLALLVQNIKLVWIL